MRPGGRVTLDIFGEPLQNGVLLLGTPGPHVRIPSVTVGLLSVHTSWAVPVVMSGSGQATTSFPISAQWPLDYYLSAQHLMLSSGLLWISNPAHILVRS
jgi:hypothetical protein